MSQNEPHPPSEVRDSREIELKFALSLKDAETLVTTPPWQSVAPGKIRKLHSVYFDTADGLLFRSGFSLRIRKEGNRHIQTIKTLGQNDGAFAERGEWSVPLSGLIPDLEDAAASVIRPIVGSMTPVAPVEAVFEIAVRRHVCHVREGQSLVEVAVDFGELRIGERREAFHELELELADGRKADLFALARKIFREVPVRLHMQAKAERGFEMLSGARASLKAGKVGLSGEMPVSQAFQSVMISCLRHLMANEAAFWQAGSPETIHQARVAMRRMRAAMQAFRKYTRDEMHDRLRAELRDLAGELGAARSIDVYIADFLTPEAEEQSDPEYRNLLAEYEKKRERAYQSAADMLGSPRYRHAILTIAEWITCGNWLEKLPDNIPLLGGYAERALGRSWKKVRKQARYLETVTEEQRHDLRIAIKKLRYGCEFFSFLFPEGADASEGGVKRKHELRKRIVRHLVSLQDALGMLNDIAEARNRNPLSDMAQKLFAQREAMCPQLMEQVGQEYAALEKRFPF